MFGILLNNMPAGKEMGYGGLGQGYASREFMLQRKKVETTESGLEVVSGLEIKNPWYISAWFWLQDKLLRRENKI